MSVPLHPLSSWLDNVALAALSSRETIQATYDIASTVIRNGIPGDLVECGVYGGANSAVMARAIMDADYTLCSDNKMRRDPRKAERRVHLFDSFEGIPEGGPHDEGWTHKTGTSMCTQRACRDHMVEWGVSADLLIWHPGWFEDVIPREMLASPRSSSRPDPIALLRLDADLYESTKVCMEHLYPLVSPGGWVIADDWALPGCRKAVEEVVSPGPIYFQRHS